MLSSLGFGKKCSWIKGCLFLARTSVLINGCPTREFTLKRGLRQGDPLSPFLFIIVMEGLHLAFHRAIETDFIRGIKVGMDNVHLSHFIYADDVIIFYDWNALELTCILLIFEIFYRVSGLKLNVTKSHVYSIGVADSEVISLSNVVGARIISLRYRPECFYSRQHFNGNWCFTWARDIVGGRNERYLNVLLDEIGRPIFLDHPDAWLCNLGDDGSYTVKDDGVYIDQRLLPSSQVETVWFKLLPRKVNVFLWRFCLDCIPIRWSLSVKEIEVESIVCPLCNNGVEAREHLFFDCELARGLWHKI
ncbi:uncharacterized protein [Rutidosis leptorrhynchoides]|uniref:uncharacterized protein n=1 Tax=Rutidosis leptorrhynchoides TaxID=125765 RepID=UPI003A9A48C4